MPIHLGRLISIGIMVVVTAAVAAQSTYIGQPGFRGVEVTPGKVAPPFRPLGFGTKTPFVTHVVSIPVRQITRALPCECYSSELQQVSVSLRVLYRIPERSIARIYQEFAGDPFDRLIAPRLQEALKEITARQSAEQIVKKREVIKDQTLAAARDEIGTILTVEDVVLETSRSRRNSKRHRIEARAGTGSRESPLHPVEGTDRGRYRHHSRARRSRGDPHPGRGHSQ